MIINNNINKLPFSTIEILLNPIPEKRRATFSSSSSLVALCVLYPILFFLSIFFTMMKFTGLGDRIRTGRGNGSALYFLFTFVSFCLFCLHTTTTLRLSSLSIIWPALAAMWILFRTSTLIGAL